MSDTAITVEGLGKKYKIGQSIETYRTLRDSLASAASRAFQKATRAAKPQTRSARQETLWALKNVSFSLERGQVLGIIGRNGAGKSTLLKILSRVTEPTTGRVELHGRVGSLLEVGTGFHPELTGRENIALNGAILGMSRSEIQRQFDEIVAFAEVDRFIDTPVKRYSSGMYLRLAFSVAAHLEPEILVVDEVLAVGDAEFQRKCLGKMGDVARQGRTVLFVSHNMSAILRLTEESIVLERGQVVKRAPTAESVDYYMTRGLSEVGERRWQPGDIADPDDLFRPLALRVKDYHGNVNGQVSSVQPVNIEFEYELLEDITGLRIGLYLATSQGEPIFTSFDTDDPAEFERLTVRKAGRYASHCTIPAMLLNEGQFVLGVNASSFRIRSYFTDEYALTFHVDSSGAPGSHWPEHRRGPLRPALRWEILEGVA